jgi:hypothetical protein
MTKDSNSNWSDLDPNVVSEEYQQEYEVMYAVSELRECPECHGSCVEDPWDDDSGPCRFCWGAGEV